MNAPTRAGGLLAILAVQLSCGRCGGDAPTGSGAGYDARPANATCVAPPRPGGDATEVETRATFPSLPFLTQPLHLLTAPGDASRVFVVHKPGEVKVFANDPAVSSASTFIDLTPKVRSDPNEGGLLGMAFHPDFARNGEVFLSYTSGDGPTGMRSVISRFRSTDGGRTLDPGTEEVLVAQDKVTTRHNGGTIAFGPDGYLYIALGDDGSPPDERNRAQDLQSIQGKILRIDVNVPVGYAIPSGNPFAGGGGRGEIFAWGFRNPWRFSFDRATGELWAGDVGEVSWEEVDRVVLGGNYGWPIREGSRCYGGGDACASAGLIPPVAEYPHSDGVSVSGGVVYRGTAIPSLAGKYLYADFESGKLWGVDADPGAGDPSPRVLLSTGMNVVAFAELPDGEVLLLDMWGGAVHRLDPAGGGAGSTPFPQTLSATGCFDPASGMAPVAGLIPYDVNAPLWSDGAAKQRFLAVPDGKTIHLGEDGDFELPEGSVLAKTFLLGDARVETRLFMRHPDGVWAGYSYEWNDAQTDATLLAGSLSKEVAGRTWYFPSRAECLQCHTSAAGRTLGLETAQLNGLQTYPSGRVANQLATLDAIGMFDAPLGEPPEALAHLANPGGGDALEARARAYLHANCSGCHRPGGPGGGNADLRADTPLADMRVCDATPEHGDLGVAGAKLVAPGEPERSIVSRRMHALGPTRMPPLATRVVDEAGVALVDAWIASLGGCP